jgi:ANTAR domain
VLSADLDAERRWPRFVDRVRKETSLRAALAVRLPGREASAMSFYADRPDAFDETAVAAGSIVAAHAAGLLVVGELTERTHNLELALGSNRQIGMAIGILMARHKVTEEDAFGLLRVASQALRRKLRDVAAEVMQTGALPNLPHVIASAGTTVAARAADRVPRQ